MIGSASPSPPRSIDFHCSDTLTTKRIKYKPDDDETFSERPLFPLWRSISSLKTQLRSVVSNAIYTPPGPRGCTCSENSRRDDSNSAIFGTATGFFPRRVIKLRNSVHGVWYLTSCRIRYLLTVSPVQTSTESPRRDVVSKTTRCQHTILIVEQSSILCKSVKAGVPYPRLLRYMVRCSSLTELARSKETFR